MKRFKYIVLSFLLAISFVGCENVDFGDINKNENGPSDPYTSGLLASAIMSYSNITGRDYLIKPTLYVQYQSQVTYVDEMLYNESQASWYQYYVTQLSNLQEVIDYCSDPANANDVTLLNQGSINNQIGVSLIMQSIIFKRVTDTWGDVPYTEALHPFENLTQNYDDQEVIYKGIIENLKKGRDMLEFAKKGPTGDIIYGGDVTKWYKLANSVILQASLQLSKKYPSPGEYAQQEFMDALGKGVIETVDEEAWFTYEDFDGFRNPWFANRPTDYFNSKEWTDALNGIPTLNPTSNHTKDYRIFVYSDSDADGVPYGHADGSGAGASSMSDVYFWAPTASLPMMTAAYTYLNRAEAAERGWTAENAVDMLDKGIKMSYRSLAVHKGMDQSFVDYGENTYAPARISDAAGVGVMQVIGEEKWVALFPSGFDAWSEWRRTGYPDLKPAVDAFNDGTIPRRYLYPGEEASLNGDGYAKGVSTLVPASDNNTSHFWWDQ